MLLFMLSVSVPLFVTRIICRLIGMVVLASIDHVALTAFKLVCLPYQSWPFACAPNLRRIGDAVYTTLEVISLLLVIGCLCMTAMMLGSPNKRKQDGSGSHGKGPLQDAKASLPIVLLALLFALVPSFKNVLLHVVGLFFNQISCVASVVPRKTEQQHFDGCVLGAVHVH